MNSWLSPTWFEVNYCKDRHILLCTKSWVNESTSCLTQTRTIIQLNPQLGLSTDFIPLPHQWSYHLVGSTLQTSDCFEFLLIPIHWPSRISNDKHTNASCDRTAYWIWPDKLVNNWLSFGPSTRFLWSIANYAKQLCFKWRTRTLSWKPFS